MRTALRGEQRASAPFAADQRISSSTADHKRNPTVGRKDEIRRVIKIINELLPLGCPTEETLAYKLHMSKRTLQRKLSQEKQSFLTLLTSVRLILAKQQLAINSISITEITYQLGYSSPSTFARAFKKQTSLSPVEFRDLN